MQTKIDCACAIPDYDSVVYCGLHSAAPDLLVTLKSTQDIVHLAFCVSGTADGDKTCVKECRQATEVLYAADPD